MYTYQRVYSDRFAWACGLQAAALAAAVIIFWL